MRDLLKLKTINPEYKEEFEKNQLNHSIGKLMIALLGVCLFLIVLLVIEFSNVIISTNFIVIMQLTTLAFCLIAFFWIKYLKRKKRTKELLYITYFIYIISVVFTCVVAIASSHILKQPDFISYFIGVFLLVAAYFGKPRILITLILFSFTSFAVYINNVFDGLYSIVGTITSSMLVMLLCIYSLLRYSREVKIFMQDMSIRKINDELLKHATTDELTGLNNRRLFMKFLENERNKSKRYGDTFSIVLLDIDKYKQINDIHGHIVGDNFLKEFATTLKGKIREVDLLSRWGGDEFIIAFSNTNKKDALELTNRIREKIDEYEFEIVGKVTFSAGVSEYSIEDSDFELINRADIALYNAKKDGRNCVKIYQEL